MKLSNKFAVVSGSGAFVLISYSAFFHVLAPLDSLTTGSLGELPLINPMKIFHVLCWSFLGAVTAGWFGHSIGEILQDPKGSKQAEEREPEALFENRYAEEPPAEGEGETIALEEAPPTAFTEEAPVEPTPENV